MNESGKLVDDKYQKLYADYYTNADRTVLKRRISAAQTLTYMRGVVEHAALHRLLDVGAGDGNVLAELDAIRFASELHAVEISESGVKSILARDLPSLQAAQIFDGYKIPYPDKHFDLAIAVHVLEHVEHERLLLQEIRRVAKFAYIEVPLEHGYRVQRSIDQGKKFGHINFYTKETIRGLVESCEMEVVNWGIAPSSLQYEQHLSGKAKGWLKSLVRRSMLVAAPRFAPWLMVYNGYVFCKCG